MLLTLTHLENYFGLSFYWDISNISMIDLLLKCSIAIGWISIRNYLAMLSSVLANCILTYIKLILAHILLKVTITSTFSKC